MRSPNENIIPKAVIERIPLYLQYINDLVDNKKEVKVISSKTISTDLGLGEVQVRKDFNLISGTGKPKIGYSVIQLKEDLEKLIKKDCPINIVIIGAGKIGRAMVNYLSSEDVNFRVVGLFDNDPSKINENILNMKIKSVVDLESFLNEKEPEIAVLAVPSQEASKIAETLDRTKIKGILNFSSTKLKVNKNIYVKNVDIASLLIMLAVEINNNKKGEILKWKKVMKL